MGYTRNDARNQKKAALYEEQGIARRKTLRTRGKGQGRYKMKEENDPAEKQKKPQATPERVKKGGDEEEDGENGKERASRSTGEIKGDPSKDPV
jgi:hypothetical protein